MKIAPCLYGTRPFRIIRQTELAYLRKFLKMQSPLVNSWLKKSVNNITELFHLDWQRRNDLRAAPLTALLRFTSK